MSLPTAGKLILSAGLLLVGSDVATILTHEWVGAVPVWLAIARSVLLGLAALVLWRWEQLRVFAGLALVLLVIVFAQSAVGTAGLRGALGGLIAMDGGLFDVVGLGIAQKALIAVPVAAVLLLVCRGPANAYFAFGRLSAPVGRMALLRLGGDGIRWHVLAPVAALLIALGTFAGVLVTVFDGGSAPRMQYLLPMLPAILLLAALNAFLEGVIYRNAICGPLRGVLPTGTLALFAGIYFGIAHYYGAPSGVAGVMLASVLGWFLCRAMIETRGFLLPWGIHFVQDIVIFGMAAVLVLP
ncbi:MAG: CPBP family intramembrane metalloprotease [Rhodobacteraceae bacterium]|nr:MAG: CPBP family intramembrane metalloprotease [Paracoccaceae bacterium]